MGLKDESRGARRAPRSWALPVAAAIILTATPGWSQDASLPRCEGCAGTRKVRCATCDGRGEIHAVCDICKGAGRKPCAACAATENGASASPGKNPCGLCKGRGTRESTGKACSRCRGRGSSSCSACLGKGTVRCAREKYERICPDCRFTGKMDCPSCSGGSEPSTPDNDYPEAAGLDQVESAPAGPGRSQLPPQLEARHRKLMALHGSHMDIFAVDVTRKAEAWKTELARLERKIEEGGESAESLEKFLSRVTHFRLRYGELRDVFLEAYRAYKVVGNIWRSRDRALESAPPSQRDEIAKEQDERLEVVIGIAEAKAAKLEAETPTWLLKEIEDLTAMHAELKTSAEASLALIEKNRASEEEARRAAREAERQRRAAEKRAAAAKRPRTKAEPGANPDESEDAQETEEASEASIERARPESEEEESSMAAAEAPGSSSGAVWAALACAAGGFAAGAAVILFRKGKRSVEPTPIQPEPAARR